MSDLCDKYIDLICRLPDGELAEPEKTGLAEHLAGCSRCRLMFDAMHSISLSLSQELEPPAELCPTVMAAIRAERAAPTPQKKPRVWLRYAAMAACAALVIGVGVKAGLGRGESAAPRAAMFAATTAPDTVYTTEDAGEISGDTNELDIVSGGNALSAPAPAPDPEPNEMIVSDEISGAGFAYEEPAVTLAEIFRAGQPAGSEHSAALPSGVDAVGEKENASGQADGPLASTDDAGEIDALLELLLPADLADVIPELPERYELYISLTDENGVVRLLRLWTRGGEVFCIESDGEPYKAACTVSELRALLTGLNSAD